MRATAPSVALALAMLVAAAAPRTARADGSSDADRAKELFEHGRDLRAHGNCADALPLFQKAYSLYPAGLGSLRNVAVCDEALGRPTSARSAWLELRKALAGNTDPKYAGWADDADRAAAHLAPQVANLTVDVLVVAGPGDAGRPASPSDGIDVTVDGQALGRDQLGVAIERDPGKVVVRAVGAPGITPEEATATLAAGESKRVTLRVTTSAPPAQAPAEGASTGATEAEAEAQPETRSRALRTGAWIAMGAGVAGLAGTAISFSMRQAALGTISSNCEQYQSLPCAPDPTVTSALNQGRTASTLVNVFGAVGIVGTITGVVLFTLSARSPNQTAIVLTPGGAGAVGVF